MFKKVIFETYNPYQKKCFCGPSPQAPDGAADLPIFSAVEKRIGSHKFPAQIYTSPNGASHIELPERARSKVAKCPAARNVKRRTQALGCSHPHTNVLGATDVPPQKRCTIDNFQRNEKRRRAPLKRRCVARWSCAPYMYIVLNVGWIGRFKKNRGHS